MEWFSQNWVWVLFFVCMVMMHMLGHGGHGVQTPSEKGSGHQH